MNGFPRHLNTKQDYLNCLKTMPEQTRQALREVYDARMAWMPVRKLSEGESPKLNAKKKIVDVPVDNGMSITPDAEQVTERWLYEYQENQDSWFFYLGFTKAEAEAIINA
jgi:hypothetical protein